jgi:hypothetical protein
MSGLGLHPLYRDESREVYQVTETALWQWRAESSGQCLAQVRPIAVVVLDRYGSRAIGMNGEAVDVGELRRVCPELESLLGDARNV